MSVKLNFHCLEKLRLHASVIHMYRLAEASVVWAEKEICGIFVHGCLPKPEERQKIDT